MNKELVLEGTYEGLPWKFFHCEQLPDLDKITAISCLPLADNKVALVRNTQRGWEFPGGHLNSDESIAESVAREIWEEACATIDEPRMFGFMEFTYAEPFKSYPFPTAYIVYFYAKILQVAPFKPLDKTEISERGLFNQKEATTLLPHDFQEKILTLAMSLFTESNV